MYRTACVDLCSFSLYYVHVGGTSGNEGALVNYNVVFCEGALVNSYFVFVIAQICVQYMSGERKQI